MNTPIYRFAEFRVDAAQRTLRRGEDTLAIAPKAFDCLVYLIQQRERAVGRDELIAAVWGRADVSDGVLGQTILLVRRALDERGRETQFIRTVPRFGYHWTAPVTLADAETALPTPAAVAETTTPPPAPVSAPIPATGPAILPRRTRSLRTAVLVCAAIVAAALADFAWRHLHAPPAALEARGNLALVLPVEVADQPGSEWMRLGLMDFVAARLRSRGQPVVPSENVVALSRAYVGARDDPAQLAAFAAAVNASLVIGARAEAPHGRWRVSLRTLRGREPAAAATGEADDALAAAAMAADRLAAALGLAATSVSLGDIYPSDDPLDQRVGAAVLGEDLEAAQKLLDDATPAQRERPQTRYLAAKIQFQGGRLDAAETSFAALADAVPAAQDTVLHARTLNALGAIELQRDRPERALVRLDDAVNLLAPTSAFRAQGDAYNNRATAHGALRHYDAALADFAHARTALESADDAFGVAVVDSNAGALAMNRDRYAEALPILAHAADRFAAFRAYAAEMNARSNMADTQLALLDPAAAMLLEPRLRELDAKVAYPERRRRAALARAEILFENGLVHAGQVLLGEIRAEAERAGDAATVARTQSIAAGRALAAGDPIGAERDATSALRVPPEPQDPRWTGLDWLTLVRAQLAREADASAAASLEAAARWAQADDTPAAHLYVALARAEYAAARDAPDTDKAFEDALALAERSRVPVDLLEVSRAYVEWLLRHGDTARASAVAEGVAGWAVRDYDAALLQVRLYRALDNPTALRVALERAQALAGERTIPTVATVP